MEFGQPYYLLLILILPLLVLWYFKKGQNHEATIRFSNLDLIPESVIRNGKMKNIFFIIGRLFIMLLIIFALARPRLSDTIRESKTEIVDILLVIDQSSSMLAQDFKPNRLEAAKEVAKKSNKVLQFYNMNDYKMNFSLKNLFDEEYQENFGYNTPGRSLKFKLNRQF